jgi:hypothetical protein
MAMLYSAEARWFFRMGLTTDVRDWFVNGQALKPEPDRPDDYLWMPNCETVGVKLRDGKKFEVKSQVSAPKLFAIGPIAGRTDEWIKWSFDAPAFEPVAGAMMLSEQWIRITKLRYLRKFSADSERLTEVPADRKPWPAAGCNVELTAIKPPDGVEWVSLAFEAFGPPERTVTILNDTMTGSLALDRLPSKFHLSAATSFNYPAWLATFATDRARSTPAT